MLSKKMLLKFAVVGSLVTFSAPTFAQDHASHSNPKMAKADSSTKMTPELKMDMATMYEKMGACMKTDKSMAECQKEVMKDCPVTAKTGHCPIMEGTGAMKGGMPMKMHDGMKGGMKGMSHPMGPMGGDSMGNGGKGNE